MRKANLFGIMTLLLSILALNTLGTSAQLSPMLRLQTDEELYDVAWSPDGQLIAVGGTWGIKIFNSELQEIAHLVEHSGAVVSVSWHPDSQMLASATSTGDATIRIWKRSARTNEFDLVTSLSNENEREIVVTWSPDGTQLASMGGQITATNQLLGNLQIWNIQTWTLSQVLPDSLLYPTRSLIWSPDSSRIAVGGWCAVEIGHCPADISRIGIYIADVGTQQFIDGFSVNDTPLAIAWNSNQRLAVSISSTAIIYDALSLEPLYQFDQNAQVNRLAWSSNGDQLAIGFESALGGIINIHTGRFWGFDDIYAGAGRITGLSWSPNNALLASVTRQGYIEIWDVSNLPNTSGIPTLTPLPTYRPTITPTATLTP